MVLAVRRLFDANILLGVGPVIENGFYQDFDHKFSDLDLPQIEAEMRKIIAEELDFSSEQIAIDDLIAEYQDKGQKYKVELLEDIKTKGSSKVSAEAETQSVADLAAEGKVTVYAVGIHRDLCRGPHVGNTKELAGMAFKLDRIAGAYWRGSEKNPMLTRIYAIAFGSQAELDQHYQMIEEAHKRDHRKLGQELDLFTFSELVGSGLPLFTPRGAILREELNKFSQQLRLDQGFQRVWSPHITKNDLYKTSGHWDKFGAELFLVKSQETDDEMVMKPMNCPHHQQIYAARKHSYRELPIKYLETTTNYRDEKAGELLGLSRVRSLTQDDSHTFCTPEQIEEVYQMLIDIVKTFYNQLGMTFRARLSFRDPNQAEKYLGEPDLWEKAQGILLKIAQSSGLDYYIAEGEAAFYGPKIDFMVKDALGREWQLATPQLDFVQPQRFDLKYTASDGSEQTPVMIHFALMGSLERFLSVYIEHTGGFFPTWVAPLQIKVLPLNKDLNDAGLSLADELKVAGVEANLEIKVEVDQRDETLQAKIRDAAGWKVPYTLILGKRELEANKISVRVHGKGDLGPVDRAEFINKFIAEVKSRQLETAY